MNEVSVTVFGTQFTASAVLVFLGHLLEHWFPKLATVQPTLKRTAYWIIALASAVGVHASFNEDKGVLIVTGLTVAGIAHALWHWVQSVALQEFVHRSTK